MSKPVDTKQLQDKIKDILNERIGVTASIVAIGGISMIAVTAGLINEFLSQYSVLDAGYSKNVGSVYEVQMAPPNYSLMRVAVLTQANGAIADTPRAGPKNLGVTHDKNVLVKDFYWEEDGELYPVVLAPGWFAILKNEKLVMLPRGKLRFIAK